MEPKKSKKDDLESRRKVFLEWGFLITLGLVLLAFEWSSTPKSAGILYQQENSGVIQENVPVTQQENQLKPPPPPPPPKTTEILNIVENDVHIEDELDLEGTGADENTSVFVDAFPQKDEEEEDPQDFMIVEETPTFQGGGVQSFRKYVLEHLSYPTEAAENGIEGTVFIQFVIDKDGSISKIVVLRGVDPSLNNEATRVIRNAPKWEPGKQRGKAVRVKLTLPVVFKLQ